MANTANSSTARKGTVIILAKGRGKREGRDYLFLPRITSRAKVLEVLASMREIYAAMGTPRSRARLRDLCAEQLGLVLLGGEKQEFSQVRRGGSLGGWNVGNEDGRAVRVSSEALEVIGDLPVGARTYRASLNKTRQGLHGIAVWELEKLEASPELGAPAPFFWGTFGWQCASPLTEEDAVADREFEGIPLGMRGRFLEALAEEDDA